VLLTDVPDQRNRLRPFARTTDGFKIAELDLKDRGMGELAGTRQAGGFLLRFANLETDGDLVVAARKTALALIAADENLTDRRHAALRRRIERRYERGIELFRVG
jgi:ATP-dependent DNA helicase RecG